MITEEIRSYEVSIWTLQDEFITVLKWSDAEKKGRIENPKMVLNIDGTQTFDFSIPMYYQYQGRLIDNPSWYNTLNGNLLEGMRKIKVIFNKGTDEEEVFEFLIVKMTDNHEKDVASCDIKCEGLAFHELGKQGYKISLSLENFEVKYKKWAESDKTDPEPLQTIDYWCGDKTTCNLQVRPADESQIDPSIWYYTVCMNQKSFKDSTGANARVSTKIYEEPYPTNWNPTTLIPESYEEYREKARTVTADKSNLYNLTQSIAEAFQVHCTYKYAYDANYHITSRTIVFYNSFFQEENGAMSFTYPYSSSKITRDSDCTNLTTKLYVLTTDNDKTVAGYNSIMNASTNPSHEDYILNFDYMLDRDIISQDQYDAIKPYEIDMKNYNEKLIGLQQNLATYNIQKPEIEAKVTIYERSIALDNENIAQNQALSNALDIKDGEADGSITIDEYNPDMRIVQKDKNDVYYINLETTNKGIKTDTVHIYRHYNGASHNFPEKIPNTDPEEDNEITDFTFEYDEYGRPARIRGVAPRENSSGVYLTYKYNPKLYYDAVVQVWNTKLGNDEASLAEQQALLGPEEITPLINSEVTEAFLNLSQIPLTAIIPGTIEQDYYKRPHILDENNNIMTYYSISAGNGTSEVLVSCILPDGTLLSENVARSLALAFANDEITGATLVNNTIYPFREIFMGEYSTVEAANTAALAYHNYHEKMMAADGGIRKLIKDTQIYIDAILEAKNARIKEFERLMGAALREGYWQPEDYKDYGINKENTKALTILQQEDINVDTDESFIAFWDEQLFDEENKNYYEEGVNLTHVYYPCIDLHTLYQNSTFRNNLMNYSFIFNNNYNETIESNVDIRFTQVFRIGSGALLEFGKINNEIHPLLVLVGAKSMSNTSENGVFNEVEFMQTETHTETRDGVEVTVKGGNPRLCIITDHSDGTYTITNSTPVHDYFVDGSLYTTVYPRIKFSSLNLRADSSDLVIRYSDDLLEVAKDYVVQTRNTLRNEQYHPEYFITIKPDVLYKNKTYTGNINIHYILSNADNQIYLDALEVSKENAYPKVEYTVAPNILNRNLSRTLYQKLATLVMINDTQLKLENVFGYISKVELDLDNVSKDQVEVKNYTSKFEDLFSTIVAQTEQMKQDSAQFHAAMEGAVPLKEKTLERTLVQNESAMSAYLDSYFDSSEVVRAKLESLFTEAGEILGDSSKTLNQVHALSIENAEILSNFAQNVSKELTTNVVKSSTKPSIYKPGDVWIQTDGEDPPHIIGRYVATSYNNEGQAGGTSGFVKTYDGTLASITGAAINIDAQEGKIDILAQNELNLKSGHTVYIAAGDTVEIVGNDKVNIGGTQINLCSLYEKEVNSAGQLVDKLDDNDQRILHTTTGINLIAGTYSEIGTGIRSEVLISPTEITMGSANILMRGSNKIQMITSRDSLTSTSAISISPDDGVWIGSGNGVRLYSGNINLTQAANGVVSIASGTGASAEFVPDHLLFGVSNSTGATTAIKMTDSYVVIGAGNVINNTNEATKITTGVTGTSNGLVGAKFTKDSIGFATGSGANINAILMNGTNGITIGSGSIDVTLPTGTGASGETGTLRASSGSYVRIASSGIELGSLAKLYVNMDNFKLQTDATNGTRFAVGSGLNSINLATLNTTAGFTGLVYNTNGLFINGTIYASDGSFTGDIIAKSFQLTQNGTPIPVNAINSTQLQDVIDNRITTQTGSELTDLAPIGAYGLLGQDTNKANQAATITSPAYDSNGYPKYGNQSYGLILGNNQSYPMLIGSDGGIHIINTGKTGTAVVIDQSGIDIASGGNLNIETTNFCIHTDPTTGQSTFRLGPSGAGALINYNNGSLTINANDQIWLGVKRATASGTSINITDNSLSLTGSESTFIKLTTDSLYLNGEAKVVMTSQDELILSGTDGAIQYAKHKLFTLDTMCNSYSSIVNQGIIIGDYIYLTTDYTDNSQSPAEVFKKGIWQLVKDSTLAAGIKWESIILYEDYSSDTDWESAYGTFIAENFNAESFSLQIDRKGVIRCQRIECYGDIYCYGKIYNDYETVFPIPEETGISAGEISGNSLLANPIIFTI